MTRAGADFPAPARQPLWDLLRLIHLILQAQNFRALRLQNEMG